MITWEGWATIVFLTGSEAREALEILDENGAPAAIEYLRQWDYGEREDVRPERPWGANDSVWHVVSGDLETVLSWRKDLAYISLQQRMICEACGGKPGHTPTWGCTRPKEPTP